MRGAIVVGRVQGNKLFDCGGMIWEKPKQSAVVQWSSYLRTTEDNARIIIACHSMILRISGVAILPVLFFGSSHVPSFFGGFIFP